MSLRCVGRLEPAVDQYQEIQAEDWRVIRSVVVGYEVQSVRNFLHFWASHTCYRFKFPHERLIPHPREVDRKTSCLALSSNRRDVPRYVVVHFMEQFMFFGRVCFHFGQPSAQGKILNPSLKERFPSVTFASDRHLSMSSLREFGCLM